MRSAVSLFFVVMLAVGVVGCASTVPYETGEPPSQQLTGMTAIAPVGGTVARVDAPQQVIVLDDGRMYRVAGERAILVNGQPRVLTAVQPGQTPVVYQNGQYVVASSTSGTVVTAPAGAVVSAPAGTVVTAPSATVVTAPATALVTPARMYGSVVDVERNGNVKVRLADGTTLQFRPPAGTVVRKGDMVTMDITFGAAVPAASPR